MKRITPLFILFLLALSLTLTPGIENPDKPLKGEWELKPELAWVLESSEDFLPARPNIVVSDDGTCYVYDYKTRLNYIFDRRGNFKGSFGKPGEGPGEIKWQLLAYTANNNFIVADRDKLHYFTKDGTFRKSVPTTIAGHFPRIFIDENKFVAGSRADKGEIAIVDLKNGKTRKITGFEYTDKAVSFANDVGFRLPGLHSEMIVGYDFDNHNVYYGINDSYTINAADSNGKVVNTFSVAREKKTVSKEAVIRAIEVMHPDLPVKEGVKGCPTVLKYYNRIQVIKGLVYVFTANFGSYWDSQQIDIFSLDGKYLYRTSFTPGEGSKIYFPMLNNILIKKDHLYVVLENDEGEVVIAKYKTALPGR